MLCFAQILLRQILHFPSFALFKYYAIYANQLFGVNMATYRKRGNSWRVEICVNGIRASSSHDTKAQAKHWAIHKEVEMKSYYSDIPRHTLREALVNIEILYLSIIRVRSGKCHALTSLL